MESTNLNIRTDKEVKIAAERIFEELGLNMTTAVNIFLRQTIRENGIPFELKPLRLRKAENSPMTKPLPAIPI